MGAFESAVLHTEHAENPRSSFGTLRADVPSRDVAEAAIRCAVLGRPEI